MGTQSTVQVCADIVDRARAGDENAMAMICEIRNSARRGSVRALECAKEIRKYISTHPVQPGILECESILGELRHGIPKNISPVVNLTRFGGEALFAGSVALANSHVITSYDVKRVAESIPTPRGRRAFLSALRPRAKQTSANDFERACACAARCILLACALQAVRSRAIPITVLNPVAGWELGE